MDLMASTEGIFWVFAEVILIVLHRRQVFASGAFLLLSAYIPRAPTRVVVEDDVRWLLNILSLASSIILLPVEYKPRRLYINTGGSTVLNEGEVLRM
jgi:hypothetical protein